MKKVTIKDIARDLGISVGTVYRALSDTGRIHPDTKRRVLERAGELDYRPNSVARKLALRNRFRILVSMPLSPDYYWDDVREGYEMARQELSEFGVELESYWTGEAQESGAAVREILSRMESRAYDGLVIAPLPGDFSPVVRRAREKGVPLVLFNEGASVRDRLFYYGPDNHQSGLMAGELLGRFAGGTGGICALMRGRRESLYAERLRGFRDQLAERYPDVTLHGVFPYKAGREAEVLDRVMEGCPGVKGLYVMDSSGGGVFASLIRDRRGSRPCIVGHEGDELARRMLEEGLVTALLCEKKVCQGYYPVKLLYEYLAQGVLPSEREIYTDINVVIRENLRGIHEYRYGRGYR